MFDIDILRTIRLSCQPGWSTAVSWLLPSKAHNVAAENAARWCEMCKTIVIQEQWEELGPHRRREGNSGVNKT